MSLEERDDVIESPDPHFEPLVNLPAVQIKTLEENEDELVKLRAKLFRYDTHSEPREWKERGTGEVKILKHKVDGTCRILMRRDKTFKICANHLIFSNIDLKPNCGSERAWVWSTLSDFSDEEPKPELLAIRFGSVENAQLFKEAFEEAKRIMAARLATADDAAKDNDAAEGDGEEGEEDEDDKEGDGDEKYETEKDEKEGVEHSKKSTDSGEKSAELSSDLEKLAVI